MWIHCTSTPSGARFAATARKNSRVNRPETPDTHGFDGTLTTIRAHERGADGTPHPSYRCLFPEPPLPGTVPACAEAGILGALTGVLGSMMALEVIREIVGFGEGLVGRLLMVDARAMRFETLGYAWDKDNPLSGEKPAIRDLSIHR